MKKKHFNAERGEEFRRYLRLLAYCLFQTCCYEVKVNDDVISSCFLFFYHQRVSIGENILSLAARASVTNGRANASANCMSCENLRSW